MPLLTKKYYSKKHSWSTDDVITKLPLCESWADIFQKLFTDKRFQIFAKKIQMHLIHCNPQLLYPKPNYLFKAFNMCPLDEIKVVFIGQDPYFNHEIYNDKIVPQAYGLSFSVPIGFDIPSSLNNIYNNLKKYKHIKTVPNHGCLDYWVIY